MTSMNKLKRVFEVFNGYEVGFFFKRTLSKIIRKRISNFAYLKQLFIAKSGLEVGGPSRIFRDKGFLPLYKIVKELDGCNFSNTTIWEGNIESGKNYNYYKNKKGVQYISEATDLSLIPNLKYDFVISSNCLEHVANPLKAINEWIRVLKDGGLVLLVLPNKEYCFDHNRPVTEFSHLLSDFQNDVNESDLTHLNEILELHDLKMDKKAGNFEQFRERSLKNFDNRALHQHVFNIAVLKEIFSYFKLDVLLTHEGQNFIILGKKNDA
jgi:SAM-dependent methyltransferase